MKDPNQPKTGTLWGVPYDWRRPTKARYRSRLWNPNDRRIITPRAWGWGYDINFYRVFHRNIRTR